MNPLSESKAAMKKISWELHLNMSLVSVDVTGEGIFEFADETLKAQIRSVVPICLF